MTTASEEIKGNIELEERRPEHARVREEEKTRNGQNKMFWKQADARPLGSLR